MEWLDRIRGKKPEPAKPDKIDELSKKVEELKLEITNKLEAAIRQPSTRLSEERPPLSYDFSQIENRITEIERLLKFREGIKGGELLEKGNYFMKSVPGEIEILKSGKISGIEYSRRVDILKFGLHLTKIFFESIERPDLVERTERFIEEVKRI